MKAAPEKGQKMQAVYALHWIKGLSPSARKVAAWLVWHANGHTGRCDPGQKRLQDETELSRRSVQNAVQALEEFGVLTRRLRGSRSTEYCIRWSFLSDVAVGFENASKARKRPTPKETEDLVGASSYAGEAQVSAPQEAQVLTPKPCEMNVVNETMFRVGIIHENDGVPFEEMDRHNARYLLAIEDENAFLSIFEREMKKGLRLGSHYADMVADRIEQINSSYDHRYETPLGRSWRLLYSEFYREDEAA